MPGPGGLESNEDDKEGGDLSTGVTFASRSSKYNVSSSSSVVTADSAGSRQAPVTNVVNGNLAPPQPII